MAERSTSTVDAAEPLTDRQRAVLDFIRNHARTNGFPPTLREIGKHFGIRSTNGVNDHLRALERKGHLRRSGMKSRGLQPVPGEGAAQRAGRPLVEVRLAGRVAAGMPALAVEQSDVAFRLDPELAGPRASGQLFALRVRGDSMIDAGIRDGDVLVVRRQEGASAGETVVALVGDEATVKRFEPERDGIRLVPANSAMQPIVIRGADAESVHILGVAVGVYRRL